MKYFMLGVLLFGFSITFLSYSGISRSESQNQETCASKCGESYDGCKSDGVTDKVCNEIWQGCHNACFDIS